MDALDARETTRNAGQIDAAIDASTDSIESFCHRIFYPFTGSRRFDWPNDQYAPSYRLYFDQHDVVSINTLVSGGITLADYFLRPYDGPPYTHVELDRSASGAFSSGDTPQASIVITGVFGHLDETPVGTLATTIDASTTTVDVLGNIGVGSLLRIDDERMIVVERDMLDTGAALSTALASSSSNVGVAIDDASSFVTGEVVQVGSEQMKIISIAGNLLTVRRAWNGSVLATHELAAPVFAGRRLTVERAAVGTTAAAHTAPAVLHAHRPPALVRTLAIAETMADLLQQGAGYARTVGTGDNERESAGKGLTGLREQVYRAHGRQARMRTV